MPSGASATALADIPQSYLMLYQQAAADCPGLDWTLLAAIGKIESDHGRSRAPGVTHAQNLAGAAGPMQFLQPTFAGVLAHHRLPANGATPPSRYDPHDAIHAAAAFLCDHHATARCVHTTSRAAARAEAIAPNLAVSSRSSSCQHVESDATAPNRAA